MWMTINCCFLKLAGVNIFPFCVHKCAGEVSCERQDWEKFLSIKTKFMSKLKKSFPYGLEVVSFIIKSSHNSKL